MFKKIFAFFIIGITLALFGLSISNADVSFTNAGGAGTVGIQFSNGTVITSGVAPTSSSLCLVTGASGNTASFGSCTGGGSGVPSVNSITGAVTIAASGPNVTVTTAGNTVSIGSTGGGGSGVPSVNTITGAVTIAASGPNVTVTTAGNTVSIASTGGSGNVTVSGVPTAGLLTTWAGASSIQGTSSPSIAGQITWPNDGDQQYSGNTDLSKYHRGGVAQAAGGFWTLLGAGVDFVHDYGCHNISTNPTTFAFNSPDDPTSTSYCWGYTDSGLYVVYEAGAGVAMSSATLKYELDTVTGNTYFTAASSYNSRTVTATGNIAASDVFIRANATSAAITLTLPATGMINGQSWIVKKVDTSSNAITISGNGILIDGASTVVITSYPNSITIWYDSASNTYNIQ